MRELDDHAITIKVLIYPGGSFRYFTDYIQHPSLTTIFINHTGFRYCRVTLLAIPNGQQDIAYHYNDMLHKKRSLINFEDWSATFYEHCTPWVDMKNSINRSSYFYFNTFLNFEAPN